MVANKKNKYQVPAKVCDVCLGEGTLIAAIMGRIAPSKKVLVKCPHCNGTGNKKFIQYSSCDACDGAGIVKLNFTPKKKKKKKVRIIKGKTTCRKCWGAGKLPCVPKRYEMVS